MLNQALDTAAAVGELGRYPPRMTGHSETIHLDVIRPIGVAVFDNPMRATAR